jgi:hypothetical protein
MNPLHTRSTPSMRDFEQVAISLRRGMDGSAPQGYAEQTMMITLDDKFRFSLLVKSPKDVKESEELSALTKECQWAHAMALVGSMCVLYFLAADPASTFLSNSLIAFFALIGSFLIHAPQLALLLVATRKSRVQHEIFFRAYQAAGGTLSRNENYAHTRRDNLWRLFGSIAIGSQPLLIFFFDRDIFGLCFLVTTHLIITGIYMSWALLTPYFEMQKMSYGEGRAFIAREFLGCMSLGISTSLLCLIPIIQFRYISSVIAGTGKWVAMQEQLQERSEPNQEPARTNV